ncbi:MAG: DUF3794 and LysM peptidoglycan-binding domain-containing protein [Christensenellales bacterium]|jgi:LysM repeat protein
MKVQKSSFKTETACDTKISESLVEGKLSVPSEKADIERILFVQGKVHVNTQPADGKVLMDGIVKFNVIYIDSNGGVDSFESLSPFRHSAEFKKAGVGMNVYSKGYIREVEHSVDDKRTVYVKGIVSMSIRGSVMDSYDAVSKAESDDMQVKMHKRRLASTKEFKRETAMVREDIRIPQSMPRAEKILCNDAYAVVKSIKTEDLKIIVEGEIKMMILYLSEDKNAPIQHFYESLPFGEIFSSENVLADDIVMADADMYDTSVDIAEDEGDILRLYAKIDIIIDAKTNADIEYMEDAYSLKRKLNIKYKDYTYQHMALCGCVKAIARCTIAVPQTHPSVSRIVCMKASPVIVSATPNTDRVYLEGLMMFTICYASPEGLRSYCGETPFEAEAQMEGVISSHQVDVAAEVEYCSFEGAGRDISVKFMMDIEIRGYSKNNLRIVSDLEDTGESTAVKKGITIYFADEGESVWDIAKRYSTTLDTVKKFNPDIGDNVKQGQKILIMS